MEGDGTRWYRRIWWSAAGVAAVLTFPFALLTVPVSALVVIAVFAGALAASLTLAAAPTDMTPPSRMTYAMRTALAGAAVAMVTVGLLSSLGGSGLLAAVCLAGSSPPVARRLNAWREKRRALALAAEVPVEEDVAQLPPAPPVASLSTAELVRAWRGSFNSLLRAQTTAAISAIVVRRQQYLDELERRDPAGLQRWLASGARAASDPTRYLRGV